MIGNNIEYIRLIPLVVLTFGVLFMVKEKKFNVILLALASFLSMEVTPFFIRIEEHIFFLFFFSSLVYFILVQKLYTPFFKGKTQLVLKIGIGSFITLSIFLYLFLFNGYDYRVIYHNLFSNLLFMAYPVGYLIGALKERKIYNSVYFNMSCIFFGYFVLEIILSVVLGFLFKIDFIWNIPVRPFRFGIVQLFYISLIYFGWKLGKIQKA